MNINLLQHELESLQPDQQDQISAFLTSLRMKRDGLISEMTRRLDDTSGENWEAWDKVKAELDEESS